MGGVLGTPGPRVGVTPAYTTASGPGVPRIVGNVAQMLPKLSHL